LRETERTHLNDLGWPPRIAASFQAALRERFPEALVDGYEHLLPLCNNDPRITTSSPARCSAKRS
jgi:hypothetical protein